MRTGTALTLASLVTHIFAFGARCSAGDLVDEEPFVEVFNGKDLAGWVVEGTKESRHGGSSAPVWSAKDGIIHCDGAGFGFLRYDQQVSNFVLKLEFRLDRGVNSGVGIRHGQFTGAVDSRPSIAGYEIQLLDDSGKQPSKTSSGSLYRYVAAERSAVKPAGQWNELVVEGNGPHLVVHLNGLLLHDFDQRSVPETADKPLRGYFSLQNHGGDVAFRRIYLRELK